MQDGALEFFITLQAALSELSVLKQSHLLTVLRLLETLLCFALVAIREEIIQSVFIESDLKNLFLFITAF